MILVTVGMHSQPFDRLVIAADEMAVQIDEKVFIQRGVSKHEPQHAEHVRFVSPSEMDELMRQARVIVAQPGAGTVLAAADHGKPLIVVPRSKQYGEHIDDHQMELAEALKQHGVLDAILQPTAPAIRAAVEKAKHFETQADNRERLLRAVRAQLAALEGREGQWAGSE